MCFSPPPPTKSAWGGKKFMQEFCVLILYGDIDGIYITGFWERWNGPLLRVIH